MHYSYVESPIGDLLVAGDDGVLKLVSFPRGSMAREPGEGWERKDSEFDEVRRELGEYFEGKRESFDVPLEADGTDFQRDVLGALQQIPYGETRTYGEIAEHLGKPKASRAVGAANGRNPIPILIPCHRVIGSDGSLTGFGGGIDTKEFLLSLERRQKALFE
ncbi:MAG: methylated-DNA--[protein]-cysteine S-methyltransferase [Gammaproteobacteria bacterium]|nr:methylated-DNA--[protein]-cysteine S-methyltransferase [Gammaproteobacteria bacterium]